MIKYVKPVDCYNDKEMIQLGLRHSILKPVKKFQLSAEEKIKLKELKKHHNKIERKTGSINTYVEQQSLLQSISLSLRNKIRFNGVLIIS